MYGRVALFGIEVTARECQVAHLLAQGLTNQQIADDLGVIKSWVGKLVSNVYDKTGMWDRDEFVLWYLRMQKTWR